MFLLRYSHWRKWFLRRLTTGVGKTGVVGLLRNGDGPKPQASARSEA